MYDQGRSVTLSVRILKSNPRSWNLYAERWANGKWRLIEGLGERESQAAAYCEAGAWIAVAARTSVAQEDTFEEDHWR